MSSFAPMPFKERLAATENIVRGKAGKTLSQTLETPDGPVVTSVTEIEVTDVLKGGLPQKTLQIFQPGGEIKGVVTYVAGVAKFEPDQDVVLFLGPAANGIYSIPGLETGQYTVKVDSAGQEVLEGVGYPEGEKPWLLTQAKAAIAGKLDSNLTASPPGPTPEPTTSPIAQMSESISDTPPAQSSAPALAVGLLVILLLAAIFLGPRRRGGPKR